MIPENQSSRLLLVSCAAVILILGAAYIWPLHFWGINFHAYLPIWVSIGAMALGLGLSLGLHRGSAALAKVPQFPSWVWSLGVAVGMWALFYNLVVQTELYGDSRIILSSLGEDGPWDQTYDIWGILSPNVLSSKNGEHFTYSLVDGIRELFGCTVWGAFRMIAAGFGLVYAFVWMEFVQQRFTSLPLRVVAAVIGLTAGITQLYYGQPEVYAAPILVYASYFIALVNFVEKPSRKRLAGLAILVYLAIRVHSAGFTFAPSFAYALLVYWAGNQPERQRWLAWNRAGILIVAACLLAGVTGYLTVFKAGAEVMEGPDAEQNIFLTLTADDTHFNAYAMFTRWHLWDYAQELLLCSAPAIAILLAWALAWRPFAKGSKAQPAVIAVSLGAIILGALYFAIDPVLTMPRDWDLCGLIAPSLMVLALMYLSARADVLAQKWLPLGLLMGIGFVQFTAVVVNQDKFTVHRRLLDVSQHVFISGDGGGAWLFRHTLGELPLDEPARVEMGANAVYSLKPHLAKHNRSDYAFMCQHVGGMAFLANDLDNARKLLKTSLELSPDEFGLYGDLAGVELHDGDAKSALLHGKMGMRLQPQYSGNYDVTFKAAVVLGDTAEARTIGQEYLRRFPKDPRQIGGQIVALEQPAADSLQSP